MGLHWVEQAALEARLAEMRDAHATEAERAEAEASILRSLQEQYEGDQTARAHREAEEAIKAAEVRERRIAQIMSRSALRMRHMQTAKCFLCWRDEMLDKRRRENLMRRVVLRFKHLKVSRSFAPWAALARLQHNRRLREAARTGKHARP
jgi:hypothetical protein